MASFIAKKISVNIKLNDGTDSKGNTRLVSLSLGRLNKDNFNVDKVLAIIGYLEPCLNKSIEAVEKVEAGTLTFY